MTENENYKRAFIVSNRAWYKNVVGKKEVVFGMYDLVLSGTTGEMAMRWHDLNRAEVPRIECFDDAWKTLFSFTDVLEKLADVDNKNITQDDFIEILLSCGFVDKTEYERGE